MGQVFWYSGVTEYCYTAQRKGILELRSQRLPQVAVSLAAYSPASGKGYPFVSALLGQERVFQLGIFTQCSSFAPAEGFPGEVATVQFCSRRVESRV